MLNHSEPSGLEKLWGKGAIRVFISHKAEYKKEAAEIKSCLDSYGIASFVAHEDIEPMKEWESEIERALFSMDVLVALMTERFSESNWTDQEIGAAVGLRKPVVPVRLGTDPYGFIGRYQAISGTNKRVSEIAEEIHKIILNSGEIDDEQKALAHSRYTDNYIAKVADAGSFASANYLAKVLPSIEKLSAKQENALVRAFNENDQVHRAFEFNPDIIGHLKRMTGNDYMLTDNHRLELLSKYIDHLPF